MRVDGSRVAELASAALLLVASTSGGCAARELPHSRAFDVTVPVLARSDAADDEKLLPSSYRVQPADDDESERACCKGMNDCKGKGGCAVENQHDCAGKNECKGLGGCNAHCPR